MRQTLNYSIKRGEVWERLVMIKDRRTRRVRKPTAAAASVLISGVAYTIPCSITSEGGVLLEMTPEQTKWLVAGTYPWDAVATVSRSQRFTQTPASETVILSGTLTVESYDAITPMAVDLVAPDPLVPVV